MARRAGVVPFSLASAGADQPHSQHRVSPSKGHSHSHSQGSVPREIPAISSPRYGRASAVLPAAPGAPSAAQPLPSGRSISSRRGSGSSRHQGYATPHEGAYTYAHQPVGLAPIQTSGQPRGGILPSVAELTTGVSPYTMPAYSIGVASASPIPSGTTSPGALLPSFSPYPPLEPSGAKRRASPDMAHRETTRRRHLDPRSYEGEVPGIRRST